VAPYLSLLNLLVSLTKDPQLNVGARLFQGQPSSESEAALVAWCERYGLLGLLLQQVYLLRVPFRHDGRSAEWLAFRTPIGWSRGFQYTGNFVKTRRGWTRARDTRKELPLARVLIADLRTLNLWEEPATKTWAGFFPDLRSRAQGAARYPWPLTESFWRSYAEPVESFLEGALLLRDALNGIALEPDPEPAMWAPLDGLLGSVGVSVTKGDDGITYQFGCPSLLAAFTLMAVQDRAQGHRPGTCGACGNLCLATTRAALYCSVKCRNTAQKRRQRRRAKAKEAAR